MAAILIVDDDEIFSTALGRIIKELGHFYAGAVDGHDGLRKYRDGCFDLVIADLKMPRMDGVEFIRELKRIDRDAAVMVITGYSDMGSVVKTLTTGAYDYVEKPVSVEKFKASLERGLEKRRIACQFDFVRGLLLTITLSIPFWFAAFSLFSHRAVR